MKKLHLSILIMLILVKCNTTTIHLVKLKEMLKIVKKIYVRFLRKNIIEVYKEGM